jgi:methylglutaconyl-CoA hydratase
MSNEMILVEKQAGIATIYLNRPEKRNAMNQPLMLVLLQQLKDLSLDINTKVVLISGKGDHFCAGGDINAMHEMSLAPLEENKKDACILADLMYQLYNMPQPTIALAQGATRGGGLGLLAASDMVLAAKNASFGFSEVKIGITPSIVSPYVIAAIGRRWAQYYFLTGDTFTVDEACRIGLVHEVTAEKELLNAGIALAQRLLSNSPKALIEAKKLIRQVAGKDVTRELVMMTAEHLMRMRASSEGREGLQSFIDKRPPNWEKA